MTRGSRVERDGVGIADIITELDARNYRPGLFALTDDMLEAELVRTGQLTFPPAA